MSKQITKIKLHNYKRFTDFSIAPDQDINVFVGDNDAGKSSILNAIEYVLSGSASKVTNVGFENLINVEAVSAFLNGDRTVENLPEMWVEIYLNEQNKEQLNGRNNSEAIECDGLKMTIGPIETLTKELSEFLNESGETFPFDYYQVTFSTFSGESFYGFQKHLQSTMIDNTKGNDDYAISEFIKSTYSLNIEGQEERARHHASYRAMKADYTNNRLSEFNARLGGDYSFQLKTSSKSNLETDLSIIENGVSLENHGKGQQVMMKAELTIKKSRVKPDVVLIEEPENHLSHSNMSKLIQTIKANSGQLFISTHSNLISSRLDLKHCILINSSGTEPLKLAALTNDTSDFFMKAPPHNVLDFVLAKKVILVEGVAEYILMKQFFENTLHSEPSEQGVHIITVGGTAFKRYLEIAKILDIKTAVIRDNDGDINQSVKYQEYTSDRRRVFTDSTATNTTFEISFHNSNTDFCQTVFGAGRRTLSVQEYMLKNKADSAFEILKNYNDDVTVPDYIESALRWINE